MAAASLVAFPERDLLWPRCRTGLPQRAIRLIVPQAAGGGSDTIARFMAPKLGDSFGQQIVVDNRPGAAGMLGAEMVKQATADGYTMLLCAIDTIPLLS